MSNAYTLEAGRLLLEANSNTGILTLRDAASGERLLVVPDKGVFVPSFEGRRPDVRLTGIGRTENGNGLVLSYAGDGLERLDVIWEARIEGLTVRCAFAPSSESSLGAIELFPAGTKINMYDLINFRNRHHTPHTWPELNFGMTIDTTTYSNDWQFAPHPSMFVLRKDRIALVFGALSLSETFGMSLSAEDFLLRDWRLDYGGEQWGLQVAAGQTFESPVFCLFSADAGGGDVYSAVKEYADALVRGRWIPDPADKPRIAWHRDNLYCTWHDQGYRSSVYMPTSLEEQSVAGSLDEGAAALNERLVLDAVETIERERLPFRTILIDAGWAKVSGEWVPHPERFPDFRGLVDRLHAKGFKVIVWWNWAELYDEAFAETRHLIAGGKKNRHGRRMRDYSHPATQSEYLLPLLEKMLSSAPGCYDVDGVKTDFLADKVHADMPIHDPAWRGEENYFYRVYKLFYGEMKRIKPDSCHIGCAGHPYLAEFTDINRTYDIFSSDPREHLERARMLQCTSPGTPVAFDFHCYAERHERYFDLALEADCSVQIGNVLAMRRDYFSPWEPADAAYYGMLRAGLERHAGRFGGAEER
ncbi:TIM-barrel domain-containing protein [Cohnella sp. GCM10027633]|uniref:TIM-barrel domain-containing protein n=1 Tax=unclassified Cohnella TaxID=2636738 RepID=UPI00363EBF10